MKELVQVVAASEKLLAAVPKNWNECELSDLVDYSKRLWDEMDFLWDYKKSIYLNENLNSEDRKEILSQVECEMKKIHFEYDEITKERKKRLEEINERMKKIGITMGILTGISIVAGIGLEIYSINKK